MAWVGLILELIAVDMTLTQPKAGIVKLKDEL